MSIFYFLFFICFIFNFTFVIIYKSGLEQFKKVIMSGMKKIVFVEKDESTTYDPVATFFSKKNQTIAPKPPSAAKGTNSNKPVPNRTSVAKPIISEKKQIEKEKPVTGKIGRKGEYLPPKRESEVAKKQQTIHNANSKKVLKKSTEKISSQMTVAQNIDKIYNEQTQKMMQQRSTPVKLEPIEKKQSATGNNEQTNNLKKKIKSLEASEAQYKRKLEELEEKEDKFYKNEQKLSKIQKQHKLCGQESKQLARKLKEKEEELKKLYSKDDIPYSKKRQILLMNQMNNLKKTNRELVARIKNYKGSDLVEISIQHNRGDILNEFDNPGSQSSPDFTKLESLAFRLIQSAQRYMSLKVNGKENPWNEQKKLLMQISLAAKEMSLECLQHEFKVPQSNEYSINLYDQIEKYRSKLEPLLSKHDLNLIISEQNIQIINEQHQEIYAAVQTKKMIVSDWQNSPKKFKKTSEASAYYLQKLKQAMGVYQTRFQMQNILLTHCLAQISFVQSWVAKIGNGMKESFNGLKIRIKQIEDIINLGELGKESLFVYMNQNLEDLKVRVPDLQLHIKQMGSIFKKRQKS